MSLPLLPLLALPGCFSAPGKGDSPAETAVDTSESGESGDSVETSDSGETADTAGGGLVLPDLSGKNLVYIHVDTMRWDRFPQNGYERATLPNLSQRDWLVVNGIYGGSSWTMPSTASLLSAAPPDVHGLAESGGGAGLTMDVPSVTEHLAAQGFHTGLFTGNSWLTDLTDMDKGFEISINSPKLPGRYNLDVLLDRALPWVDGVPTDEPLFLMLQPMNMHLPYWVADEDKGTFRTTTPPWDEQETDQQEQERQIEAALDEDPTGVTEVLNDVYDEQMLGLDRDIERLLDHLEETGRLADTVVILTADHGEVLNDGGDHQVGHGVWLREELVHVPFLVLLPGGESGPVDCVAPNQDIFPTLLEAMGLPPFPSAFGRSLREECHPAAVSQLWWDPDAIQSFNASNGRERLQRYCDGRAGIGFDLVADPAQVDPKSASELVYGAELNAAIDAEVARVAKGFPKTECMDGS